MTPTDTTALLPTAQALFDLAEDDQLCDLVVAAGPVGFAVLPPHIVEAAFAAAIDGRRTADALYIYRQQRALGIRPALPHRLIDLMQQGGQPGAALDLIHAWRADSDTAAHAMQRATALERLAAYSEAQAELDQASQRFAKAFSPAIQKARLDLKLNDRAAAIAALTLALARSDDKQPWMRRTLRGLQDAHIRVQGIDLWVPPDVVSPNLIARMAQGQYETGECQSIVQDLRPGDRLLDLGAGLGLVSLVADRACPGVACAVVEANPRLIPVLQHNLAAQGCMATILHGLAGLKDGTAPFHLATEFWASARHASATDVETVQVPDLDMTRILAEIDPTILLMDIEGAEADLLPVLDLSGLRRLVVELHPEVYGLTQQYRLIGQLIAQGFALTEPPVWSRVFSFARTAPQ